MINRRFVVTAAVAMAVAGCTSGGSPLGLLTPGGQTALPVDVTQLPAMKVVDYEIEVPRELTVSEANGWKPVADILWRGEPPGDRYAQVEAIFRDATNEALTEVRGQRAVKMAIRVTRFHAVTERTRYASNAGMHEIEFDLTLTDAKTGEVVVPTHRVDATFRAYGGDEAVAAEEQGITQRVRIVAKLVSTLRHQLTGVLVPPTV